MGEVTGRNIRERIQGPKRSIPVWVYCGAGVFGMVIAVAALTAGGSSLPLLVQLPLVVVTLAPWLPGIPQRGLSWTFVLSSTVPTLLLTWTGGSPVWFGLLALSTSRVAISATLPRSLAYGLVAAGMVVGRQLVAHHSLDWLMWKTYIELGLALGWAMRSRRLLVLRTRQGRDEHAQLAALEERRRIARDVHDVLAHTLTILMVHLNSARMSVHDDPDGTAEILDEVAQYSRHCLEEIRTTVGLLSESDATSKARGPIENAQAIEELVASYRKVGVDVDLRLDVEMVHMGRLAAVATAVWHAGYRIVQEALANATKHAAGTHIDVWIGVDDAGLHIRCTNSVNAGSGVLELPIGGNGLRGMHERVQAVGGTLSAEPEGTQWVVRADLPLTAGSAAGDHAQTLGRAS